MRPVVCAAAYDADVQTLIRNFFCSLSKIQILPSDINLLLILKASENGSR